MICNAHVLAPLLARADVTCRKKGGFPPKRGFENRCLPFSHISLQRQREAEFLAQKDKMPPRARSKTPGRERPASPSKSPARSASPSKTPRARKPSAVAAAAVAPKPRAARKAAAAGKADTLETGALSCSAVPAMP